MEKETMVATIIVAFCLSTFLSLYFYWLARHKERMALIERGMDLSDFYNNKLKGSNWLKVGVVVVASAIGLLIVGIISESKVEIHSDAIPVAIIGIFGGAGMIVANYLDKRPS